VPAQRVQRTAVEFVRVMGDLRARTLCVGAGALPVLARLRRSPALAVACDGAMNMGPAA
jgi:hypothetical protein